MHFAQNVIDKHQSYMSSHAGRVVVRRERGWVGVSAGAAGSVRMYHANGNRVRNHDMRKLSLSTALLCAMAVTPLMLSAPLVAQAPPTAQNVIPDGISYATQGKLQALDPGAGTLTIAPENMSPMPMTVAPNVSLGDLAVGDVASVHYTRTVTFTTGSPNAPAKATGTETVGQVAQNPADIATSAAVIVGRVVKLNSPSSIDVVNNNGGGIYTIKTTQPSRETAIAKLKVGDSVTVNVSPIIATSVAKCGLFGKGLFGC